MGYGCLLLENLVGILWICYNASAVIGYIKFTSFGRSSCKNGSTPFGIDLVFVLKTKAIRW